MSLAAGTRLGPYEITSPIGAGASGAARTISRAGNPAPSRPAPPGGHVRIRHPDGCVVARHATGSPAWGSDGPP
jgi:hypothetical protein